MIDFASLRAQAGNDEGNGFSFVGIRDRVLHLPKGADSWAQQINDAEPTQRFVLAQQAFILLYRTLETFRVTCTAQLADDRDSAQRSSGGAELLVQEGKHGEVFYYRQLDILDGMLHRFDELEILTLAQRYGPSARIDGARLYKELDRATFTEDHSFFVDAMNMPRLEAHHEPVELVRMYCYALLEVKRWLGEAEDVHLDIQVLAAQFAELHLNAGDSLFAFATWQSTRALMLERLDVIDQTTAYKDPVFHEFHEALERFLRGSQQQTKSGWQWGISTFAPVWEAMCLEDLLRRRSRALAACDVSNVLPLFATELSWLPEAQTLRIKNKTLTLRTTSQLKTTFAADTQEGVLFPDAVLLFSEQYLKESFYQRFVARNLADVSLPASVPPGYIAALEKVRLQGDGYAQNAGADELRSLIKQLPPDPLTAFYIGRALCACYQPQMMETWSRHKLTKELLRDATRSWYSDFVCGMVWEVLFHKNDACRSEDSFKQRKGLASYALAMDAVKKHAHTFKDLKLI